jgi:DNA-binding transcriptional MerR regulator
MIKIGDFSKLSLLSVKTLRYYDEMGLLKPVQVDRFTGYRFYSASQLPRLNRILALKEMGLTLEQIRMLLENDLPVEQLVGILRRRQVELRQEMRENEAMLQRVEARLRQFEQENTMPKNEVTIKSIPALWVASVRGIVPTYPEQYILWDQLEPLLQKAQVKPAGPCFTLDHDPEYHEKDHDLEVCEPLAGEARLEAPAQVRLLPAVESMASLIHEGPFSTLYQSYQDMLKWIETNGYQIVDCNREIYVEVRGQAGAGEDAGKVTEIQFPVKRV